MPRTNHHLNDHRQQIRQVQENDQIHAQARARCQQQGRQDITHLFQIAIVDQLLLGCASRIWVTIFVISTPYAMASTLIRNVASRRRMHTASFIS